ncbi:8-oxo-dGTP pyrophosphatase MutT (NUDIX family) [Nocardioides cavernae]|uniref:8-oxo-dGTP pyrophosphatase MutT (NUDIX family) n=1 Tax=Nocardioides cavernae TaxID=1921566 RepID=A0A7Y9H0F1_9ACTN|nr:NUDIX domain-containing protein [Nocardioides cavernae]NYE35690.1 8-oxo-dGTP pyrophosphatase MutT (NUDIX family) [Nocardioides cavernae]
MTVAFALVPASYVYLLREGGTGTEVLLQQRGPVPYMPGHWAAAAAGHVEPGETAYDAARREALEELGITDVALDFAFTMQRSQFGPAIEERVDWFFTARSWLGEPRVVEPEKAARLGWYALDALPEPMVPHEAYALAHLGSGVGYLTFGWGAPPHGGGPGRSIGAGSTARPQGGNP